ncbi:Glycogen synthase [Candidatus Ornithobacterium hominis]|uniref:Glycogen synthase n=1 Tax=Candidatus Ornithobacterium hominis TaxID=2497989 RepID=A0A383TUZ8_9FLAO|nr:glycosyltransferase family 4 protein [Candidatus Ornithobacterium hominis]MCT7904488.1 glycosyltransferase family 4 protein [Candidatus Ornithobacterium hominis]CAI9430278.1 Glycogen synthase [Candidatus Ornithobacterium hominis]SZD71385.1 Glycogen synthase [Candidatus Ornithobacterium hominis]
MKKPKIVRITTVPLSLDKLLEGQLKYMANHFEVIAVSCWEDGYLKKIAEREGVQYHSIEMTRSITPAQDLKALFRMVKFLRQEKPEIVHSITPKAGLLSMVAAKLAGVPIRVHTFTGLIFPYKTGILQKILILTDKILCACATHIIPEGKGVKDDLIRFNITSKRLEIIGNGNVNGINAKFFSQNHFSEEFLKALKKNLNISENDFVFIFVGRLVKDKGINELITAFSKIQQKNLKLLLVGSFEQNLDPLEENTLTEINQNPNIISVGWQNDVRPYFAISDALVFPSYREGFPNVVMQAGAMGLPSIVSDINGCNEIIIDNVNGIIIPAKDENAIQSAMKNLYENKVLYQQLKSNSRTLIISRFPQKLIWNEIKIFYTSALAQI